jgi:hypothetical protein
MATAPPAIGTGGSASFITAWAVQPVIAVNVIIVPPGATPKTNPEVSPTVAVAVLELLHVPPPVVASVNCVVPPVQTTAEPAIAAGSGFTVKTAVIGQPGGTIYEMRDVPSVRPVTVPVAGSIVATAVLVLLHVPPVAASVNVVLAPTHNDREPPIAGGVATTVTVVVVEQPVAATIKLIVAVPGDIP